VDLSAEIDGPKGGHSLAVAPGFDIAKSWQLSLEFWAPKFPKDRHALFFWGDERPAHDAVDVGFTGFALTAMVDNDMGGVLGPTVTARLSGTDARRWVAVRYEHDAALREYSLFVDGKRVDRKHSPIVPTVDRPMPVHICHASGQNRFSGRVRNVRLENVEAD
jgi:hypothetical protein